MVFTIETENRFDEDKCIETIKHFLPSQPTLKDFVHHNPLHAFQEDEFFKGIFRASKIFGYKVSFNIYTYRKLYAQGRISSDILEKVITLTKGKENLADYRRKMLHKQYKHSYEPRVGQLRAEWKSQYKIDLDNQVHPLLFRILGSFLDQGIALWHFPFEDEGLLKAIRKLEKHSLTSFFSTVKVKNLLQDESASIEKLLSILVGDPDYYTNYLFDQQFAHKGWSGMFCTIEANEDSIFYKKKVTLKDIIFLELLLEIDAVERILGENWKSLSHKIKNEPIDYFSEVPFGELEEMLKLWQESFEWDYYDKVLSTVASVRKEPFMATAKPSFQAIFCIDDRECSIRRHLENIDEQCETLGAPGFFGAAFYFQPYGAKFYDKSCPVNITPKHIIKEIEVQQTKRYTLFHSKKTHSLFNGFMSALSLGLFAGYRMVSDLLNPKMKPDISNAFAYMDINGKLLIENNQSMSTENSLQVGFKIEEMADIVASLLKNIGLSRQLTQLIYVIAHGSSSANNPHHGAHDCGACSGRPGGVNARVFAYMANHKKVRTLLNIKGIYIPESTQFIAAMHNTASDEIQFYDEMNLSSENSKAHIKHKESFEKALDLNALERSRRFASINTKKSLTYIRQQIKKRSVSYYEPRPELGHGTNALCFVGSRQSIKEVFFDRRVFLQSYDYRSDLNGNILSKVLAPIPGVCGGINLEYFFSRMDIEKMGAGTKLPHNVTGLIGVTNSIDGDLRTGLPLQMIENHDPLRMLLMIEHFPEVILKVIQASKEMFNWFNKGWIHLVAVPPESSNTYYFSNGQFELYEPISKPITIDNSIDILTNTSTMKSVHILDATQENVPTHKKSRIT